MVVWKSMGHIVSNISVSWHDVSAETLEKRRMRIHMLNRMKPKTELAVMVPNDGL